MPKRRRAGSGGEELHETPRKASNGLQGVQDSGLDAAAASTTPRRSILRGTPTTANATADLGPTPKSLRKVLFSTPAKAQLDEGHEETSRADLEVTPTTIRNDRSARRKSRTALQQHAVAEEASDLEDDGQDKAIAREILGGDEDEDENESIGEDIQLSSAIQTPTKTGRPRGRPKGKRRERTPSPPPDDLPPHELYFFHNRAGGNKTSATPLSTQLLLKHEEYYAYIEEIKDSHEDDIKRLKRLHRRAFDQWSFELDEGYNLCLYGYGSKRNLATHFAQHLYAAYEKVPKIVIVNGYAPALTIRDILNTFAMAILPKLATLPAQPATLFDLIATTLTEESFAQHVVLIINSMDHAQLRKPAVQSLIAQMAAHPCISLVATCDSPNFPLLWDIVLTRRLRFLYHDATTFEPYSTENETIEDVNALLGRSGRRLGGKDGVGYVLKSLPENARTLFRILVGEQLALADAEGVMVNNTPDDDAMSIDDILGAESEREALAAANNTPSRRSKKKPKPKPAATPTVVAMAPEGVEYRALYHKAVEEFVCSSELNFRTLLKEFHDHQMIESRKDAMGMERLVVPLIREELEGILEELV